MCRWLDSITNSMGMNLSKLPETAEDREAWHATVHGVAKSQTQLSDLHFPSPRIIPTNIASCVCKDVCTRMFTTILLVKNLYKNVLIYFWPRRLQPLELCISCGLLSGRCAQARECRLRSCDAWAGLPHCNLSGILVPRPRTELESPALQGRFLTSGPLGKLH